MALGFSNVFKYVKVALILAVLAGFLGTTVLVAMYHNDSIYSLIYDQDKAFVKPLNSLGEKTDIVGGVKNIFNPVPDSNYINLEIDEKEFDIIKSGINKKPRKKPWSKARLLVNNEFIEVDISLHGSDKTHYQNNKFSFKIKSNGKEKLINGWRRFTLIKGEEGDPSIAVINSFAKKMGLISNYGKMVILKINDSNVGHYYLVKKTDEKYIEKNYNLHNTTILRNTSNWTRKEGFGAHMTDLDFYPGHIEKRKTKSFKKALREFAKIKPLLDSNNVAELALLFDAEYIGKYLGLATMFNDNHFFTGDNLKLVYDSESGKFYPIYRAEIFGRNIKNNAEYSNTTMNFDKFLFNSISDSYNQSLTNKLFKLLLSDSTVYNERNKTLSKFVANKDEILLEIKRMYKINENVIAHSSTSRRSYYMLKKRQCNIISAITKHAKSYLKYGHVYGVYDNSKNQLSFQADCFSNIKVYYKNKLQFEKPIRGITVKPDLNLQYNEYMMKYKKPFKSKELVFVNMATNDTIPNKSINFVPI